MSGGSGKKAEEGSKKALSSPTGESRKRPRQQDPGASSSGDSARQVSRGGYRTQELRTIPKGISIVSANRTELKDCHPLKVLSNFVELVPMKERLVYKYRVDFEPNIESVSLRRAAFRVARQGLFGTSTQFDDMYDVKSATLLKKDVEKKVALEGNDPSSVTVKIKKVGTVPWNSFEMLRMYNTNTNDFLRKLGFFRADRTGGFVHSELRQSIRPDIYMLRGFRTSINTFDGDKILMNMEPMHKLLQARNVLELMSQFRGQPGMQEIIRSALVGRLVMTNYGRNSLTYRIEDVNFSLTPQSTFFDERNNKDCTYLEYFKRVYDKDIEVKSQPLLVAVPNSGRKSRNPEQVEKVRNLVPELCFLSGMTDEQRADFGLKRLMLSTSKVDPRDRVSHMSSFLNKFHSNLEVKQALNEWGYNYGTQPLEVEAYQLPVERIGLGRKVGGDKKQWPTVDAKSASFDHILTRDPQLAVAPRDLKLAVLITRNEASSRQLILRTLGQGFERIGLTNLSPEIIDMNEGNSSQHYVNRLRNISSNVHATIAILTSQHKEKYDAIKKLATVERGIVTQVVTAKLMNDSKRANGAALKIAMQVVAKVGGEPWYVNLPLQGAMFCGYDTYHDTANRGRSFGAFVASVNNTYSKWFSRADSHDIKEELTAQIATNMRAALKRYHDINKAYPTRIFLYRDGVGDGDLNHVFTVELEKVLKEIKQTSKDIKLTMIIVNKRIGARFYMRTNQGFGNLPPGSCVDTGVTRKERFDFYLVSQHTGQGTVTPTYYNIIHDESGFGPSIHQAMAYKLTMLYYNWTGTVRVPAPCQYAHKLALLCGEHLHQVPNTTLDDRLHFL